MKEKCCSWDESKNEGEKVVSKRKKNNAFSESSMKEKLGAGKQQQCRSSCLSIIILFGK